MLARGNVVSRLRDHVALPKGGELTQPAEGDARPYEVFVQLQRGKPHVRLQPDELRRRPARAGLDALVNGSVKLSELGARLAAEASQPILTQLGKGWMRLALQTPAALIRP